MKRFVLSLSWLFIAFVLSFSAHAVESDDDSLISSSPPMDVELTYEIIDARSKGEATFEEIEHEFKNATSEYNDREIAEYQKINQYQELVFQRWDGMNS